MNTFSRCILSCLLLGLITIVFGQQSERPEPVPPIRKSGLLDNSWYEKQAKLWMGEIVKDRKDETAWYNFAMATDYAFIGQPDKAGNRKSTRLDLLTKMRDAIPATVTFHYFDKRFGEGGLPALEKAYQIDPDNPLPYTGLIASYELAGNSEKTQFFLQKLYDMEDIPVGIIEYNYNLLMSTDENAILFTAGDNDTFSSWMLQQVRDIRKDVLVLNFHMVRTDIDYLHAKLISNGIVVDKEDIPSGSSATFARDLCELISNRTAKTPIYFALTIDESVIKNFRDSLYTVGLANRYQPKRYNNIPELRRNVEERFRLDYLDYTWIKTPAHSLRLIEEQLNVNYIKPGLMLYEAYAAENNIRRADYWKRFAYNIAKTAGRVEQMDDYLSKVQQTMKAR